MVLAAVAVTGCGDEHEATRSGSAYLRGTSGDLPETMTKLIVAEADGTLHECFGVYLSRSALLTSAHCVDMSPSLITVSFTGRSPIDVNVPYSAGGELHWSTGGADIYYHPNAFEHGVVRYGDGPVRGLRSAFDLAVIKLPEPMVDSITPVSLYQPADPPDDLFAGAEATVGGSNFGSGIAAGTIELMGLFEERLGTGKMLMSNRGVSIANLEEGDSGGGAVVELGADMPPSRPFTSPCAPPPPSPGDAILVGVNQRFDETEGGDDFDLFVPAYTPGIVDWIASHAASDADMDGICDAMDNCVAISNPDQANCNLIAETTPSYGTNGVVLGDACDPVPCPVPSLSGTGFVAHASTPIPVVTGDGLGAVTFGRTVRDRVDVTPILADGSSVGETGVAMRFCHCRAGDGSPISDRAVCEAAPFHCVIDPLQESRMDREIGGGAPPTLGETYWHTLSRPGTGDRLFARTPFPGSVASVAWDYHSDAERWMEQGFFAPAPSDPLYGDGSGLAGALWAIAFTTAGNGVHGLGDACFFGANCSMAESYTFGIAPDAPTRKIRWRLLPQLTPAFDWTFCPGCGDRVRAPMSDVGGPVFLTVDPVSLEAIAWEDDGGRTTDLLSSTLRKSLLDPTRIWIAASEPVETTNDPKSPRAMWIHADGTTVAGGLISTPTGFDVASIKSSASGMGARVGFGAAYSRVADALFVVGGRKRGAPQSNVWTFRRDAGWSSVAIPSDKTPVAVVAATYSHRDSRLWVLDGTAAGMRLLRIDPSSGAVDTDQILTLGKVGRAWMTTQPDGRVLLAYTDGEEHQVVRLEVTPYSIGRPVELVTLRSGSGQVVSAPRVTGGAAYLLIEKRDGDGYVYKPSRLELAPTP